MRKFIFFTITFIFAWLLLLSTFFAAQIYAKESFYSEAKTLEKAGILKGTDNGDLMINSNLTREDLVIIIARLYSEEKIASQKNGKLFFEDVESGTYYYPYIVWAVEKGVLQGKSEKKFGVGDKVTLIELETLILRILNYEEEAKDWDLVPTLCDTLGISSGINSESKSLITRGELAKIVINSLEIERKGSTIKLKEVLGIDVK